jgi:glutamyl/glutaminyl-tRNA synthetase
VIVRSTAPVLPLSNVVVDVDMQITHVIRATTRGEHLQAPRLFKAMGAPDPACTAPAIS